MKSIEALTQSLIQLTESAVSCCQESDWQRLELYQEQRAVVLEELKALVGQQPQLDSQAADEFHQAMLATRAADTMIETRVREMRQQLLDENSGLIKTQRASRVYQQND